MTVQGIVNVMFRSYLMCELQHNHNLPCPGHNHSEQKQSSRKHAYIILTPLNPTFI